MSAGTAGVAGLTAVPARANYLSALESELRLAEGYRDNRAVSRLRGLIARASAGSTRDPATETTGRARPARPASRRK